MTALKDFQSIKIQKPDLSKDKIMFQGDISSLLKEERWITRDRERFNAKVIIKYNSMLDWRNIDDEIETLAEREDATITSTLKKDGTTTKQITFENRYKATQYICCIRKYYEIYHFEIIDIPKGTPISEVKTKLI